MKEVMYREYLIRNDINNEIAAIKLVTKRQKVIVYKDWFKNVLLYEKLRQPH